MSHDVAFGVLMGFAAGIAFVPVVVIVHLLILTRKRR